MDFNDLPFLSKAILSAQPLAGKDDAQIANELSAPDRFNPISFDNFVVAVKAAGATWAELGPLSKATALVTNLLTNALAQADLAVVLDAIEGAKALLTSPSEGLKAAIDKVVADRTLTKYDIAKLSFATGDENEQVPETITASGVNMARAAAEAHIEARNKEIQGLIVSSPEREAEANRILEENRAIEAARLAEIQAKADAERAEVLAKLAKAEQSTIMPA